MAGEVTSWLGAEFHRPDMEKSVMRTCPGSELALTLLLYKKQISAYFNNNCGLALNIRECQKIGVETALVPC